MAILNQDVITEILEFLWILHSTGWDEELRPEAFRRYFIQYALVARIWTIPAEIYIFRSAFLRWEVHWQSFKSGLTNQTILQNCVRVLDVVISHKKLGIKVERLDTIISLLPNLVELRLRVEPEVNSLYSKATQTMRLKQAFQSISPTLRVLQVSFDGQRAKSHVMKQLLGLVILEHLDLITIIWDGCLPDLPELNPDQWDVRIRDMRGHTEHWPLETNATTSPLKIVQPNEDSGTDPLFIVPTIFRMYFSSWNDISPLFAIIAPHLKEIIVNAGFRSTSWNECCDTVVTACPKLERLLVLNCYLSPYYESSAEIYVLEPQDWIVPSPGQEDFVDGIVTETRRLKVGQLVPTASHLIRFGCKGEGYYDRPRYRKPIINNPKWPGEVFFDLDETTNAKGIKPDYQTNTRFPRKQNFMVAIRQPSTGPVFVV